jgi:hypothetical protein
LTPYYLVLSSSELGSTPFIFKGVATMTMLEKVARAIANTPEFFGRPPWFPKEPDGSVYSPTAIAMLKVAWEHDHGPWENWLKARAAITAMRESTIEMIEAGTDSARSYDGFRVQGEDAALATWTAMIDAALSEK